MTTYSSDWQARNPSKTRMYALRRKFGLTPEQVEEMFQAQKGLCLGCVRPLPTGKQRHVDHDHVTKRVRGLLCGSCNRVLGLVYDDSASLRRLADYLERSSASRPS